MRIARRPLDAAARQAHFAGMENMFRQASGATLVRGYMLAVLLVAAATLLGLALAPRWGNSAIDLLYLPAVLGVATIAGLYPALFAAAASALAYNFFFTAPHFTLRIDNPNDLVTVVMLFGAALVTSQLAASVRRQARIAEGHAARNATIAGLSRHLLGCTSEPEIARVSTRELAKIFECNAVLLGGFPEPQPLAGGPLLMTPGDMAVAAMVLASGERAGRGVDRAVPTEWQFHPVRAGAAILAVMALGRDDGAPAVRPDQIALLDNLLDQLALALERSRLESEARSFAQARERDTVRSTLLSSISDDIAPPLHAIATAADELRRSGSGEREPLVRIGAEVSRLERYLANLQDLTPEEDRKAVEIGDVTIDLFRRIVLRGGEAVHLTPKEYGVLAELAKHPGRVLSHAHLLRTVWGPAQEKQIDYLRVAIRGLRQKLEREPSQPELIRNEPAVGYRLG